VITRLEKLKVHGHAVFASGRIADREAMARLGLPRAAADLFVQAGTSFALSSRRSRKLDGWPRNMATHGHRSDLPRMHGALLARGPGLLRPQLGPLHITQVAALVAAALGMHPPKNARTDAPKIWR
jgi:hypothetical protein